MRNEVPNRQRPFFESFERKMRCENCNKMEIPFLFPFWQMNDIFQVEKRATSCFTRRFMTEKRKERKETVPAENLIIQRMRCVLMPSCLVRFWELCTDLRSVSLHERNFPQDSRGKYGSKKAKYGTKPTQILDWISSVVTLWIWMINQIFA